MAGNWICIDPSGRNRDANANSFVLNGVMWVICPETPDLCACVCVDGDTPHTAVMCLRVGLSAMSHIPRSVKSWNMRKRALFRAKHECAFPEWSCCARCRTEWLCGLKNNADPFALLSYGETTSNKEAKSVDSASPTTSPRTANNWDDCEKRALWKWAWLPRGFQ